MRQKERQDNIPAGGCGGSGNSGSNLDDLRDQAARFLAAGDEAINRALANSDSEAFLSANRQQGGE
jgi:hypothetical protein